MSGADGKLLEKMADANTEFYASVAKWENEELEESIESPFRQFSDWVDEMIQMEESGVLDDAIVIQ